MKSLEERFWEKVQKTDGCWLWTASLTRAGYGHINIGKRKHEYAHRLSYIWAKGAIPIGCFVLHSCDTPACVRPEHLWAGTHEENMADMRRKGRSRKKGEQNPQSKLSPKDVIAIRNAYRPAIATQAELAARFGVTQGTISRIVRGGTTKLSDEIVAEIRALCARPITMRELAERYGVSVGCIQPILAGHHWKKEE